MDHARGRSMSTWMHACVMSMTIWWWSSSWWRCVCAVWRLNANLFSFEHYMAALLHWHQLYSDYLIIKPARIIITS
jgi:hypothetical protein